GLPVPGSAAPTASTSGAGADDSAAAGELGSGQVASELAIHADAVAAHRAVTVASAAGPARRLEGVGSSGAGAGGTGARPAAFSLTGSPARSCRGSREKPGGSL